MTRRARLYSWHRLARALTAAAIGSYAIVGVLALSARPTAAVGSYPNASVADIALRYVGQPGVNACNDAGHPGLDGQCKNFANCVIAIASGGTQWPAPGYSDGFANAGGQEVARGDAVKGDVIQVGPDDPSGVLHTAIVVSNLGNGSLDVVDSNWGYTEMVNHHTWNPPAGARFWRMGTTGPIDSDGDGIPDPSDRCPSQPGPPSNRGCPIPTVPWSFENLEGDPGSISGFDANLGGTPKAINHFGTLHVFHYDVTNGNLRHAWAGPTGWSFEVLDGAGGPAGRLDANVGRTPTVTEFGSQLQVFYYDATNGDLRHAVSDVAGTSWSFETLDGSGGPNNRGVANLGQTPAASVDASGLLQAFYYDATNGNLRHAWSADGTTWSFENLDGDPGSIGHADANLGLNPLVIEYQSATQVFYRDATNGNLRHAFNNSTGWHFENLDGDIGSLGHVEADTGINAAGTVLGTTLQLFYYDATNGNLRHAWSDAVGWHFENLAGDPGSIAGWDGNLGLMPAVTEYNGQLQLFYYDADFGDLHHAWTDGTGWHFELLDGSGGLPGGRSTADVGYDPTVISYNSTIQLFYSDASNGNLRHTVFNPNTPGAPSAPNVLAAVAGDTQAQVSWQPPSSNGGAAITGYQVTASPGGATVSVGAVLNATFPGLTNGTPYTFTVKAQNSQGFGPPSPASNTVTPTAPASAPGAPAALTATAGNGQASITWSAPGTDGGSPITGYQVTASPGGATVNVGAVLNATFPGLTNGTPYTFTVKAQNSQGFGPPSPASNTVRPTANVPGAPTGVVGVAGNGQANVSWAAPTSDGGSPIIGYTVTVSPGGATKTVGNVLSMTVTGLANGTAYSFTVKATNAAGVGAASTPSNGVTPVGPPGAPGQLLASASDSSAFLNWIPPASDGGSAVTGYTVTVSPGGATKSVGPLTSTVVTGLSNGTTYTFTVKATNAAGAGPASVASNGVVPMTVPGAPTLVTATAGNGQASVTWTAPVANGGSAVTGYVVTASPGAATKTVGNVTSVVFDGLTNGAPYTFTVQAKNAAGLSATSTASLPVTPAEPGGKFHPLSPTRVLDSRDGTGGYATPWGAGQSRDLQATGVGGVPDGATAVVLNVTVTGSSSASHLTLWPAANTMPTASNLNFTAGLTVANLTVTEIGWQGKISIYNNSGTVNVIADVVGFYDNGGDPTGVTYSGVAPTRILDSRDGTGGFNTPWGPGESRPLLVRAVNPIPASATAVVVNMTVTGATANSHLTVWPGDQARPVASNLNFTADETRPNLVTVKLGTTGTVGIYNNSGTVNVIADVVGYYDSSPGAGTVHPITPIRVLDSRDGTGGYPTPWGPAITQPVTIAGANGIPVNARAVIVNITVTGGTAPSHLTAWPTGLARPTASNLNWTTGQTVPNLASIKLGPDGNLNLYNNTGTVDVIADIVAYYT